MAVQLADVGTTLGGSILSGPDGSIGFGAGVSGAGDLNGDGLQDYVISAPFGGASYVVFGNTQPEPRIDLQDIANGVGGFIVGGIAGEDFTGSLLAAAGDVNGDGIDDLLVSSAYATSVVFGSTEPRSLVDPAEIAMGHGGFVIRNEFIADAAGAGDLNGDGLDDIVIGNFMASPQGFWSGSAYVVYGSTDPEAQVDLTDITEGPGGFRIEGETVIDRAGWSVSGLGDVNGDGLDDLLVGTAVNKAYVVLGSADNPEVIDLARVAAGDGGFRINGPDVPYDELWSVSNAGDVNGDGLGDVMIGWSQANGGTGATYVWYGTPDLPDEVDLADLAAGVGGFVVTGYGMGGAVSAAGDINGDGHDDLLIGTYNWNTREAFVVLGGSDLPSHVSLADVAAGHGGVAILGGSIVVGAGDVNGDGKDDILAGSPWNQDGPEAYLLLGRDAWNEGGVIEGSAATDVLVGTAADDHIFGLGGADRLSGGAGDDVLVGGIGDDSLYGGLGDDELQGGEGRDTAVYAHAAGPVVADLAAGIATGEGTDLLIGIENLVGSAFDDTLRGDDGDNRLSGGAGDDHLVGGGGRDTVSYADATGSVMVSLVDGIATGQGHDTLEGIESVVGSMFNDHLIGDAGDNWLTGRLGDDTLNGGDGIDTVSFAYAANGVNAVLDDGTGVGWATGEGDDTLLNIERVVGSAHADHLTGSDGDNWLTGGAGDDLLQGMGGDDRLMGGAGDDTLIGGQGADLFVFAPGGGFDEIRDFTLGVDRVSLTAYGFDDFSEVLALLRAHPDGAVLNIEDGSSVTFTNVAAEALGSGDFILA